MTLKPQDVLVTLKLTSLNIRANRRAENKPDSYHTTLKLGWERFDELDFNFNDGNINISTAQPERVTLRSLANSLAMSVSEVNASVKRARQAKLIKYAHDTSPKPIRRSIEEFLMHGLKYVFLPEKGAPTRGIPTSYASPFLSKLISYDDALVPVWPDMDGTVLGYAFSPLYKSVTTAIKNDLELYELLALIDVIRDGKAREVAIAEKILIERLLEL